MFMEHEGKALHIFTIYNVCVCVKLHNLIKFITKNLQEWYLIYLFNNTFNRSNYIASNYSPTTIL